MIRIYLLLALLAPLAMSAGAAIRVEGSLAYDNIPPVSPEQIGRAHV